MGDISIVLNKLAWLEIFQSYLPPFLCFRVAHHLYRSIVSLIFPEQENRWYSTGIYFTEPEKYGKPTVTHKEHSRRKQNLTSHDQFKSTKLYRKTNLTNRTKQKIPVPKKAQPSRLSDYLNTGLISFQTHDARCRYPLFRGRLFCSKEEGRKA